MKRSFLFLILASVAVTASAADSTFISSTWPPPLKQLAEPPFPIPARTAAPDTALHWTHLYREVFLQGAATFEYKKQQYAIKPMFRKGAYDLEKKAYISAPWLYIMNVTNVDDKAPLEAMVDLLAEGEMAVKTSSGDTFKVKAGDGAISILSQGGFSEKTVFSASHEHILKLWAENSEKYKRTVHGKTIYLVPQMIRAADNSTHVGFVAGEGTPLHPATLRPMDFIALCKAAENLPCRPLRYSIPLGLKFRYLGKPGSSSDKEYFYWEIEEMINEDLYDALDDEALELSIFSVPQ